MTFRKPAATSLAKVDLLLGFEATLSKLVQTKLQGLAVASSNTHASAKLSPAKIFFNGDLRLDRLQIQARVLQDYAAWQRNRNESISFEASSHVHYGAKDQSTVEVELILNTVTQEFTYKPGFWQELKFAWTRYFALFLLAYVLLYENFMNYVVTEGAFDTVERAEVDLRNCK